MKTVRAEIVKHFLEEHKSLLEGASLLTHNVHPNEIVQIGDVKLKPSGSRADGLDFNAKFQVGPTTVFYFGTITDNWQIENEGVAGRKADGLMP
ncbi:MAG: hypothetical protein WDN75_10970 [Bacteroidota bacterium]